MSPEIIAELAPKGVLRAGINMSNFLLVTGKAENGDPQGVSPDMAGEIARRLGVPLKLVPYATPALLGDAVDNDEWDIANIGAEPQRAEKIAFSAAYCEIQSTYLVPAGSTLQTIADVDQPGVRIAMADRTAYGLWLNRNIQHATLIKTLDGLDASFDLFLREKADALAGLRPKLLSEVKKLPGARVIDGQFSAVQQAVGTPRRNVKAAQWLASFVEEAKASGFVASLIAKHNVEGLSVAPPA